MSQVSLSAFQAKLNGVGTGQGNLGGADYESKQPDEALLSRVPVACVCSHKEMLIWGKTVLDVAQPRVGRVREDTEFGCPVFTGEP